MTTTRHSALGTWHSYWREILAALVVLITRLLTAPSTLWEADEHLFVAAVKSFDPLANHPHPPGYPPYVRLGELAATFTHNLFWPLVALIILGRVLGVEPLCAGF